jgi:hypothetical protein
MPGTGRNSAAGKAEFKGILQAAARETARPSAADRERVLLLIIDMQNDSMEHGALPVPDLLQDKEKIRRIRRVSVPEPGKRSCRSQGGIVGA